MNVVAFTPPSASSTIADDASVFRRRSNERARFHHIVARAAAMGTRDARFQQSSEKARRGRAGLAAAFTFWKPPRL